MSISAVKVQEKGQVTIPRKSGAGLKGIGETPNYFGLKGGFWMPEREISQLRIIAGLPEMR